MSPSNTSKSPKGGSPTYQQMKQALFTVGDDSNVIGRNEARQSGNLTIESSSKSNSNISCILHESNKFDASLNDESGVTHNPKSITASHLEGSNQQNSTSHSEIVLSKPEQSEGNPRQLSIVDSGVTKPFNPKPAPNEFEKINTVVSESKKSRIDVSRPPPTDTMIINISLPKKVPERISTSTATVKSKGTPRRRGKWTAEEEEYVARVIQDFNSGFLNAPAGYTLRSYLSDKLQCDPMRITKKFTGESCIGKRVFHPAVRSAANATSIDKAQTELDALERRWRRRLELQQRESAKKAAASAAAANAASRGAVTVQGVPVAMLGTNCQNPSDSQTAVTQAATWLDRANVILMGNIGNENKDKCPFRGRCANESQEHHKDETNSTQSSVEDSLENQMKEVQRLIYEGPMIQQTAAGLPNLLLRTSAAFPTDQTRQNAESDSIIISSSPSTNIASSQLQSTAHISPALEPADKRMKMDSAGDSSSTGAEDAEALVGFLRSVRASAAAGQEL
mmetsp:Transcript_21941/g.52222  ORF Transcript_21941/g.52222 Transcript_21941/m.52222 type:complete len:509 (-) Transcript_21941:32-1558(-)|eukprot:CAMPEP_0197189870 /NCGR_PEP_ID=MMETSP1423-20130617/20552_1 /TAXON_ID=476441 /ORGANISM="Pseudo-nitzschia heimii, Strain UNC1101" /LENGTH=508 /DNA_ID=CAMNT_0042642109 /DNA_START=661 /DNA_END=2187 /DNA_ORIENTATION=+